MIYTIVIDKQSRTNPSTEKREYDIEVGEELRQKGNIYDEIIIEDNTCKVIRRLELNEYHVLKVLSNEVVTTINDFEIELFEGDNYIYLKDKTGNKTYAEYLVKNDFTSTYATTIQLNTAIEQTARNIMFIVNQKVGEEELGTLIEQNAEAVKLAWNQISEFIQLMILNNNASFAILDENKKVMMALDKKGQHFYNDSEKIFAEMGVQKVDNKNYISFSVPTDYDKSIDDGMAWGITTSSDNKFHPILYIKNYQMPPKNSGGATGELVLDGCNLVLSAENGHIIASGIEIIPELLGGITFAIENDGTSLLSILKANGVTHNGTISLLDIMNLTKNINGTNSINIFDNISFYKNQAGSNSFKIGNSNNYCLFTDDGSIDANDLSVGKSIIVGSHSYLYGGATIGFNDGSNWKGTTIYGDVLVNYGNVYANNFISDRRVKKNIKNSSKKAIDIIKQIKHRQYEMKEDGRHIDIGYIAQEMEKIDSNFVLKREKTKEIEERYYINELPVMATLSKAIQEQQELIEELQEKDKQKDELIKQLERRLEVLENAKD